MMGIKVKVQQLSLLFVALIFALLTSCVPTPKAPSKTANCSSTEVFNEKTRSCQQVIFSATPPSNTLRNVSIQEDAASNVTLTYSDVNGDLATSCAVTSSTNVLAGVCSCIGGVCKVTISSIANFNGVGEFYYTVTDKDGASTATPVRVNISNVYDAPTAPAAGPYLVTEYSPGDNTLTTFQSVLPATSADSLSLTWKVNGLTTTTIATSKGSLWFDSTTGAFRYTPVAYATGSDVFSYSVSDGTTTSTGSLTFTITSVESTPISYGGSFTTLEDTVYTGTLNSASRYFEPDGQSVTYQNTVAPTKGVLVLNAASGVFTYTPNLNQTGSDSFKFTVTDSAGKVSNQSTVTISITPVNDAPVASAMAFTVTEDTASVTQTLAATDVDGDALTYTWGATAPGHGTLAWVSQSAGTFTYTPTADYCGTDTFTFKATDPSGLSSSATATVTITCVNDKPVITLDSSDSKTTIAENDSFRIVLTMSAGGGVDETSQTVPIGTIEYKSSNTSIIGGSSFAAIPSVGATDGNYVKTVSYSGTKLVLEVSPRALQTGSVNLIFHCSDDYSTPATSDDFTVALNVLSLGAGHGGWKNIRVVGNKKDAHGIIWEKASTQIDWNAFSTSGGGSLYGYNIYRSTTSSGFNFTKPINDSVISTSTRSYTDYGVTLIQSSLFIDVTNDKFTAYNHGYITGDLVRLSSTTSLPTISGSALSSTSDYSIIKVDDDSFKLASISSPLTALDIDGTGSGTMTLSLIPKRSYFYVVRPLVTYNGATYTVPTTDVITTVKVLSAPDNLAFIHRWMANQEVCTKLKQTPDTTNNYRCTYEGPGNISISGADYYDIGGNNSSFIGFFVERFEVGCPYSNTAGDDCGNAYGCIGISAPNSSVGNNGNIYYNRSNGVCYVKVSGVWENINHPSSVTQVAHSSNSKTPYLPPIANITQSYAYSLCSQRGNLSADGATFTARLPRRKEQIAYSAWNADTTDSTISSYEEGTSLSSISKCNTYYANGLTGAFTDGDMVGTSNLFAITGTATSGIRSLFTGAPSLVGYSGSGIDYSSASNCQSRYGVYDTIGNVSEWVSDRISCQNNSSSCLGVYDDGLGNPMNALMLDTSNTDMLFTYSSSVSTAVYEMDGTIGPGGLATGLGSWYLYDRQYSANRFGIPLGLPFVDNSSYHYNSYQSIIGSSSSGIASSALHNDYVSILYPGSSYYFLPENVSLSSYTITLTGHSLSTGDAVTLATTSALPTGLTAGTQYWVIKDDSNTIRLAASAADAATGTDIHFTSTGSGTMMVYIPHYAHSFVASDVDTINDRITIPAHSFMTGDVVTFATTGTLPAPLAAATIYSVIRVDDNNIKLSGINLTTTGTGTTYVQIPHNDMATGGAYTDNSSDADGKAGRWSFKFYPNNTKAPDIGLRCVYVP